MRQFDLHMHRIVYVAGGPAILAELRDLTRRAGP